jgi:hypothetical protein
MMATETFYVNPDGLHWSAFEYNKHHRQEYPLAVKFTIPVPHQDTYEAGEAYVAAMVKLLAAEL